MKKTVFYFICAAVSLSLAFTSCDKEDKDESSGEKTVLEGKWVHSERTDYQDNGYSIQSESYTFNGNKLTIEASVTGVNPGGGQWGYGHKYTGTFTCTESTFTFKIEKFYSFNNDDTWFNWHEFEEGTEGQSFTFTYQIEDGHSLGVMAPEGISLGPGSFQRGEQAWYAKE